MSSMMLATDNILEFVTTLLGATKYSIICSRRPNGYRIMKYIVLYSLSHPYRSVTFHTET